METDQRKSECPYCQNFLKKIPGAKTKCPYCGNFMFVRTRPNGIREVVTKIEAEKIKQDWSDFVLMETKMKLKEMEPEYRRIAIHNLEEWKVGGCVKTLKVYALPDNEYGKNCSECLKHADSIVDIKEAEIGINLPPFNNCKNKNTNEICRFIFRPCSFYPIK